MKGLLFLLLGFTNIQAQDDCECEDTSIRLCYLSDVSYCQHYTPMGSGCGYTLDGRWMVDALLPKLNNADNFGLNGIVNCDLELLRIDSFTSTNTIEGNACDIIFTGSFSIDTITLTIDFEASSVSQRELNLIKDWSVECPSNLVIVSQAEAELWGYTFANLNQNPNTPSDNTSAYSIFVGPFGTVTSFDQGGTFQGIFTGQPNTGFIVLSVDDLNRPTIVLDEVTNDLIFGDIGIFCSGSVGAVSDGPGINNNNDRLVCNIMALGCVLVNASEPTINNYEICSGELVELPNGNQVSDEGTYSDTLKNVNNCDSIIITNIKLADTLKYNLNYTGCKSDEYTVIVNGIEYNEANPIGSEALKTDNNCDSLVLVNLTFNENSAYLIQDSICSGENFSWIVGNEVFHKNRLFGIVVLDNQFGCDSTITVDMYAYPELPKINLDKSIIITYGETYIIDLAIDNQHLIEWSPLEAVDCSNCSSVRLNTENYFDQLSVTISNDFDCSKIFESEVKYNCPLYIPNVFNSNAFNFDNQIYKLGFTCPADEISMSIYDRWGNLVFHSEQQDVFWNGKNGKKDAIPGVYFYKLIYQAFGNELTSSGSLTLIR